VVTFYPDYVIQPGEYEVVRFYQLPTTVSVSIEKAEDVVFSDIDLVQRNASGVFPILLTGK
jgi:hypothetical protein